ncbi:MAG: serpin family protein [Saccharofermentans sp.]|nr:serpin family protein [Saccharofermentans sp.]
MKTINKKLTATTLATMMLFTACAKSGDIEINETYEPLQNNEDTYTNLSYSEIADTEYDESEFQSGYNNYSFELMANVVNGESRDTNLMVSPASIMFAMDLCAAGANGTTQTEINDLFAPGSNPMEQQAFASDFMSRMNNAEGLDFSCANAIWGNSDLLGNTVNMEYLEYVEDTFDATYAAQPFTSNTVTQINEWVDEHTHHMIDRVIDDLTSDAAMVLVNAICFESEWADPYEDDCVNTYEFNNANGRTSSVDMLRSTESAYFETELATGFLKYYEGYDYAFLVMLPTDESVSANEFLANFTGDDYQEFIGSRTNGDVYTLMPEFENDYDTTLNGILNNMGVNQAFSDQADFHGITSEDICISEVIHKTHIEVDRAGTRAAAVTAVIMETCSAVAIEDYHEVICDRPYAYAIVDVANGYTPIFVGTVNNL